MRCSATHCSSQGISETARCVRCSKRVHHLCSNDVVAKFKGLLDDSPVAARFCMAASSSVWMYVSDGPDSDDAGTLSSGDGDDPGGQEGPTTTFSEPSDTSDSVVEFSSSSPVASTVPEEARKGEPKTNKAQ
ncbi:hypothetical protein DVH05_013415 [Phytophthora capsici]|nr:hypothetical protein DVH05_013415 [Phytophthora capsici]